MKKTIIIVSSIAIVAIIAIFLSNKRVENNSVTQEIDKQEQQLATREIDQKPLFDFAETEFDFGLIKQSGGTVQYEFPFIYNGDETITVTGVPTSCACTSADIDKKTLVPGDTATITVVFDPNLHAEPEGKFFKTINLLTDPEVTDTPELKIWVEIDLDLGPEAYKLKTHDD